MPNYDYKCTECGYTFEAFQTMLDEPLKECPECKGRLKRLIGTGAGVIFKGGGFYCTDYRNDSYSSAAKKDSESSVSTSTKNTSDSSAKSESATSNVKAKTETADKGAK